MNKTWIAVCALWPLIASQAAEAPAFTAKQLTQLPVNHWPTNGGNVYNQRYSPLAQINTGNVKNLKGEWLAHLNGSGVGPPYSGEAQPLVYDGVIYIPTGADDVFAIDVDTGKLLWSYQSKLDPAISTVCCGWTSRGVGLGEGKVFLGRLDGKIVALDQKTGKERWSVQTEEWLQGYTITSAPLYYNGMVITGFAGSEYGARGRIKAFSAKNGKLLWTFYTIPGPGEFGHDSWPQNNDSWKTGGATIWNTPAVDPELGLIYFSTGNAGPDLNGAIRKGDNLFTASIVALDAKTGKYRWHYQQVHHDIWDFDSPSPVVLFDLEYQGKMRKALVQVSKTGWAYILDRANGKPLIGIEERPVPQEPRQFTAPTQPYPIGDAIVPQSIDIPPEGYELVNGGRIFTPYWDKPVASKPHLLGGVNWQPTAYDPRTGHLFVCARDQAVHFIGGVDEKRELGKLWTGGRFGAPDLPATGVFAALDMHTNKIVWNQRWKDVCYSGAMSTAGDLVFVGRNDGRLTALDSRNGKLLWEFQTGAGVNAVASAFEHKGKQKIVVYAAGNLFAGSPGGDNVWLFSLDGKLDQVEPAKPGGAVQHVSVAQADVAAGAQVFAQFCASCHGERGEGGHGVGPDIRPVGEPNNIATVVTNGKEKMPPFAASLTPAQIRDVAVFVAQKLHQ